MVLLCTPRIVLRVLILNPCYGDIGGFVLCTMRFVYHLCPQLSKTTVRFLSYLVDGCSCFADDMLALLCVSKSHSL
ncbi:MAG: hypothetical protein VX193_02690, partial [Candidatus Thermoplasmatota archaeon]|nr:hypothetical protein [Candidatus Thermoplasmatota archaeon]